MSDRSEWVSRLHVAFGMGVERKKAARILRQLEDTVLIPGGLYLHGGLQVSKDNPDLSPEITGIVTRADGQDLTERDRLKVEAWLASAPQVAEFSVGPLMRAHSAVESAKDPLPRT
jgi:uncharacterized protein YggL (DUF469 family)